MNKNMPQMSRTAKNGWDWGRNSETKSHLEFFDLATLKAMYGGTADHSLYI